MSDFNDEHAGQGGSYTLNPKTGKRTLTERTQEANGQPDQQPTDAPEQAQE